MSADAVVLDRVSRNYGPVRAVSELSFSIRAGEMFGLIGPDGAGKTTTIRMICGLLRADAGSLRVLDLDPARQHREVTHSVGYLSQRFSLYADLSINENIAFFAEIHGMRDYHATRQRLLELTQLAPFRNRLAGQLSGGMKQKLALACTLIHQPRLIVLDEPTTGVDPMSRREFWKLLSEFLSQGITILMSTPYLDEAERCSRVALLHQGKLLALDTPGALRQTLPGSLFEVIAPDHRRAVYGTAPVSGRVERPDVRRARARATDRRVRRRLGAARCPPARCRYRCDHRSSGAAVARGRVRHSSRRTPVMTCRSTSATLALALLLLPAAAGAQGAAVPPVILSLDDALTRAVAASYRLAEARARGDAAAAVADARHATALPQVTALGGYTRTNHVDEFGIQLPNNQFRVIYPDIPDNYRSRLDVQWPLYTGRAARRSRVGGAA